MGMDMLLVLITTQSPLMTVSVNTEEGFQFGIYTGRHHKEVLRKNRRYFLWCLDNVSQNEDNEDLFDFIYERVL